jgi:hypothetical protein
VTMLQNRVLKRRSLPDQQAVLILAGHEPCPQRSSHHPFFLLPAFTFRIGVSIPIHACGDGSGRGARLDTDYVAGREKVAAQTADGQ